MSDDGLDNSLYRNTTTLFGRDANLSIEMSKTESPPQVASLGSLNIDHMVRVTSSELSKLKGEVDGFPSKGETKKFEPEEVPVFVRELGYDTSIGGKGANQAVASAKAGAEAVFFGCVGESDSDIPQTLNDRGVNTNHVREASVETGKAYVFVDVDGDNRIIVVEGANRRVDERYADSKFDRLVEADCILLQNEIPVNTTEYLLSRLEDSLEEVPLVILDPAPPEGIGPLLHHDVIDVITPNEHEYNEISGYLDGYSGRVVKTLGGEGASIVDDRSFSPPNVNPVDTTGAGDTFNGYLSFCLGQGMLMEESVKHAVIAASLSTEEEGTQPSMPTYDEVLEVLD